MPRLLLTVCFSVAAAIIAAPASGASAVYVAGEPATLHGTFVVKTGEDLRDKRVFYKALQLASPIDIKTEEPLSRLTPVRAVALKRGA